MSSFVIDKQEYIKAGGFFAGLAEQLNYYREPVIYWWDSTKGDLLDAEDYYKAFASLYEMNARSVMLQYGDRRAESDEADYRDDFEHYRSIAAHFLYIIVNVLYVLVLLHVLVIVFARSGDTCRHKSHSKHHEHRNAPLPRHEHRHEHRRKSAYNSCLSAEALAFVPDFVILHAPARSQPKKSVAFHLRHKVAKDDEHRSDSDVRELYYVISHIRARFLRSRKPLSMK